jgi:hypothetical protein
VRARHSGCLLVAALCAGLISQAAWCAAAAAATPDSSAAAGDEMVVRGKALEKLRIQIKRAEDEVYACGASARCT